MSYRMKIIEKIKERILYIKYARACLTRNFVLLSREKGLTQTKFCTVNEKRECTSGGGRREICFLYDHK